MRKGPLCNRNTYENNSAAPNVHLSARVEGVTNYQFRGSVARTAAAGLHQITSSHATRIKSIEFELAHKLFVAEVVFDFVRQLVFGVKCVGEPKVSDDNVAILIKEKIFQFQISVDNAFLVQVSDTRDKLGK